MRIEIKESLQNKRTLRVKVSGKYENNKAVHEKINCFTKDLKLLISEKENIETYAIDLTELEYSGGDAIGVIWTTVLLGKKSPMIIVKDKDTKGKILSLMKYSGINVPLIDDIELLKS